MRQKIKYMRNKFICAVSIGLISAGLVFTPVRPAEALFGTLTIEDLIERFGITRMDRIEDILYNMQKIHELVVELPTQFTSANITSLIGLDAVKNIPKELESFKETFNIDLSLWDWLTGRDSKTTASGYVSNKAPSISKEAADNIEKYRTLENKDNIKTDTENDKNASEIKEMTSRKYVDVNALVRDAVKKSYGDKYTEGMEEFDPSMLSGTESAAMMGIMAQPMSVFGSYVNRDLGHYIDAIKDGRIVHIMELQAKADVVKDLMKKNVEEGTQKVFDNLSKDGVKASGSAGMVWKSTASSYAAAGAMQNINQQGLMYMQDLMRIKILMEAQVSALLLSGYADFCYQTMEKHTVINVLDLKTRTKN